MRSIVLAIIATSGFSFFSATTPRAAPLWTDIDSSRVALRGERQIKPDKGRTVALNYAGMTQLLEGAPREQDVAAPDSAFEIELPMPEGGFARYRVVESPVMAPELAARYPMIKTYLGQGIDNPTTTARFDLTSRGFRAQVIASTHTSYIEPFQLNDTGSYVVFNKADYPLDREPMRCSVTGAEVKSKPNLLSKNSVAALASGANLRTYRLAVATTGEYTAAFGGTKLDGLSAVVTTINRVNGIYERELAVRMQIVANNDLLIYTNGLTDPYTNSDSFAMLGQNQNTLTTVIGNANYDIGHVFTTGGGGVASLGSVCSATRKAQGVTGLPTPRADTFDVDFVSHEMGHQFDGEHTFNSESGNCGNDNRSPSSAYEVGGGSTIQAYGGSCNPQSVQGSSDDYFHRVSLDQMLAFTTTPGGGATCGVLTSTGNTPPTVTTPAAFSIPRDTPFKLTASGSDANGDTLTYNWEQFDLGPLTTGPTFSDTGSGPLFRNFAPTTNPTRTFPSLRYILNNANVVPDVPTALEGTTSPLYFAGERLPSTSRALNFRVTARDNRAGGGGTNDAATAVTVVATAGPFAITAPNTAVSVTAGNSLLVSWSVASTTAAPISTANVQIALSTDGGYSFPTILAASTANDGSESITIPSGTPSTTRARIRVAAVGNIFFDISDADFTITGSNTVPTLNVTGSVSATQGGLTSATVVATVSDMQTPAANLTVSVSDVPSELIVVATNNNGSVTLSVTAACSLYAPRLGSRTYPILLTVADGAGGTTTSPVNINVSANSAPAVGNYGNTIISRGNSFTAIPAAAVSDANNNITSITVSPTSLPGSASGTNVSIASNGTITVNTDGTTTTGTYLIRAQITDSCGATRLREFSAQVIPPGAFLQYVSNQLPTVNGIIERGECNQLNVSLGNIGNAAATGVAATLWSATPGVLVTQPSTTLPNIATGQTQATASPFQISTSNSFVCGADANFTIVANHGGGNSPGVFSFSLPTGTTSTVFSEAFDSVAVPNLPLNWTTARTGATPPAFWTTTTAAVDTAPNAVFSNGEDSVASNSLISPAITLPASSGGASISVRHAWDFEDGYDGGVLELSTDGGVTFNDITAPAVGGVFLNNGYGFTISAGDGNPIAGRTAWSGLQASYLTTTVQLPPALNGQTIRLRFRAGWDVSVAIAGANWRIDGVTVLSGRTCPTAGTGVCSAPALLNIDDSSSPDIYSTATDGALLVRYLFGLRNTSLTQNATGTSPQRDATQIATHIATNLARFDVDGDGAVLATTDGVLIVRRLLGLSGAALTTGVRVGNRSDVEIGNAIDALRP
jgi:Metallo-peptidase family M12B Reprolysin-like